MVEVWPASLPDFVLREGFGEGFKKLAIRTLTDSGRAKRRKRFSDAPVPHTFPIEFSSDQLTTFQTFFNDTLGGGALSFTKTNPRTGVTDTFAFTASPDEATATGPDSYIAILTLELLP